MRKGSSIECAIIALMRHAVELKGNMGGIYFINDLTADRLGNILSYCKSHRHCGNDKWGDKLYSL